MPGADGRRGWIPTSRAARCAPGARLSQRELAALARVPAVHGRPDRVRRHRPAAVDAHRDPGVRPATALVIADQWGTCCASTTSTSGLRDAAFRRYPAHRSASSPACPELDGWWGWRRIASGTGTSGSIPTHFLWRKPGASRDVGAGPALGRGDLSDPSQTPIGCQTVLVSTNARQPRGARLGGPVVGAAARSTRLTLSAAATAAARARSVRLDAGEVDRVDVAVRGQPGRELGREPGEHVDDAAGQVGRRQHLGERDRGQRCGVCEATHDGGVARRRAPARAPRRARAGWSPAGATTRDHAGRLGQREVEVRARRPGSCRRRPGRTCRPSPRTRPSGRSRRRPARAPPGRDRPRRQRPPRRTGRGAPRASRRRGRAPGRGCTRWPRDQPANALRAATTASRASLREAWAALASRSPGADVTG